MFVHFFIVIAIVFVIEFLKCFKVDEYKDMLVTVSGVLSGPLGFIVGYYFRRLYTILHQICYKIYRCYLISYSSFLTLFHPIESHSPLFRTRRLGKRGL